MAEDPAHDVPAAPRGARGFWNGSIVFGLVSIPVSLFAANRAGRVSLRLVDRDGTPLARRYFCSREARVLEPGEIVRGYPVAPDRYVLVDEDELAALEPEKSREIDLQRFVELDAIDPVYFDRAYVLAPGTGATRPYQLLARVMEAAGRAGIATFVMRGREHLVALIAAGGLLRAETLRFADEVRAPADLGLDVPADAGAGRRAALRAAFDALAADAPDPALLADPYAARLAARVERKLAAGEARPVPGEPPEPSGRESAEIIDLAKVLEQRVREARAEAGDGAGQGDPLEAQSRAELYRRARALEIPGRSRMNKHELARAIRAAR